MENYFEDILEKKVTIRGKEFTFSNRIGDNQARLDSFNDLFKKTFGLSFDSVGGDYEPHVLLDGDQVCANVSVNQMPMIFKGKRCFFIQIGSVMTSTEYRMMGLGGFLLEQITKRWKDHCDLMFLFGNDSVLEYYPKFGFIEKQEYEYSMPVPEVKKVELTHLDMKTKEAVELVNRHYAVPSSYSVLSMIENVAIHEFYYESILAKHVWYDLKEDLVYCAEQVDNTLIVYDILGTSALTVKEAVMRIAGNFDGIDQVKFMFTPNDITDLSVTLHKEEDCTFFVQGNMKDIFDQNKMMFADNNHA